MLAGSVQPKRWRYFQSWVSECLFPRPYISCRRWRCLSRWHHISSISCRKVYAQVAGENVIYPSAGRACNLTVADCKENKWKKNYNKSENSLFCALTIFYDNKKVCQNSFFKFKCCCCALTHLLLDILIFLFVAFISFCCGWLSLLLL